MSDDLLAAADDLRDSRPITPDELNTLIVFAGLTSGHMSDHNQQWEVSSCVTRGWLQWVGGGAHYAVTDDGLAQIHEAGRYEPLNDGADAYHGWVGKFLGNRHP